MSDNKVILLGSVRDKLIANGYVPTSATAPGSFGRRYIDDPAAVLCAPDRQCGLEDYDGRAVLALTITVRDAKVRASILAVFAKHGVGDGPVRVASDGLTETHIVRPTNAYSVAVSRVLPG